MEKLISPAKQAREDRRAEIKADYTMYIAAGSDHTATLHRLAKKYKASFTTIYNAIK